MSEEYTGAEVEAAAQPVNDENYSEHEEQEERVPISALQAERKQRQELQTNMKMMQDHLELMRANQSQQKPEEDQFSNLQDDDVLTVGEAKKFMGSIQSNYQMSIEELKMQQAYPDYAETVKDYLPDVLKENPDLREDIQRAKNPYKLAYFLAQKSDKFKSDKKKVVKNDRAERILENSQRSGSLSAVGQKTPTSNSKAWKNMSDEEFMQQVNVNMGYS